MKTTHRLSLDDLVGLVLLLGVSLSALALMRVERQWSNHLKEAGLARISFEGPGTAPLIDSVAQVPER
jgi:hypothetical protein